MASKIDVVDELQRTANTIFDVDPVDRQRVLRSRLDEAMSLRQRLHLAGFPDRENPTFLDDMRALAEMCAKPDAVEVAAGMSLLAGEIERLRGLIEGIVNGEAARLPTLADALKDAGFEAHIRDRLIVGQGCTPEPLERRTRPTD